jgi:hypothetical protein
MLSPIAQAVREGHKDQMRQILAATKDPQVASFVAGVPKLIQSAVAQSFNGNYSPCPKEFCAQPWVAAAAGERLHATHPEVVFTVVNDTIVIDVKATVAALEASGELKDSAPAKDSEQPALRTEAA